MALEVRNIVHRFGDQTVLQDVSFLLREGELTGMIGPTGAGKSVLMKIMGGVLQPTEGELLGLLGNEEDISLMFQEGALFDSFSVFDNIAFPLVRGAVPCNGLPRAVRRRVSEQVGEILSHVGLLHAAHKFPAQLSGGMRRRVSLARALVNRPKIALLDDPTCGLDPVASSVIMELICNLHEEYRPTMVLVSHDLRRLLPVVGETIALFDGRVRFKGSITDLAPTLDSEIKTFVACRYDLDAHREVSA